ncbi:MAG: hypothetical protein FJZ86_06170 [Chloroflexi bacterium]|nr:hypothetical protein [Chloroflexota bacterium]
MTWFECGNPAIQSSFAINMPLGYDHADRDPVPQGDDMRGLPEGTRLTTLALPLAPLRGLTWWAVPGKTAWTHGSTKQNLVVSRVEPSSQGRVSTGSTYQIGNWKSTRLCAR